MIYILLKWSGRQITLNYTHDEAKFQSLTSLDAKKDIFSQDGVVAEKVRLFYEAKELPNDVMLEAEGIKNETLLHAVQVVLADVKPIKVKVGTKLETINVSISGLVVDLQQSIFEQLHIPQSLQVLYVDEGKLLNDELASLESYKIVENSVINLEVARF